MPIYSLEAPLVIIHNYLETFREFLIRTGGEATLMARRFNGDQALFWLGGDKLVFTSAPISNLEPLSDRWSYNGVKNLVPEKVTPQLCIDILGERRLLDAIVEHAGDRQRITLISYAATRELYLLIAFMEKELGLQVDLPETPKPEKLWLKEYADSKAGFRNLVTKWIGADHLPDGYISDNPGMVADIARDLAFTGKGVVIKANTGGSGVGNSFLTPRQALDEQFMDQLLCGNTYSREELFVVEEFIHSSARLSPSLEFYVPPDGKGDPALTYLSNQHFEPSGRFSGVIVSKSLNRSTWYPQFESVGKNIAAALQRRGYVGHFDLDAIVDDEGHLYLVEINSRRTGGTFIHEFMSHQFGEHYQDEFSVFSQNKIPCRYSALKSLEQGLKDLLFDGRRGVIILLTSQLPHGGFGYAVLGESIEETIEIRERMLGKMQ